MRVLIVEDDCDLALAISEYLELHHLECDFAYTGESGTELALTHRFDSIVLDNMLPRTQGVEVCKALRSKGVTTPILILLVPMLIAITHDLKSFFSSGKPHIINKTLNDSGKLK